MGDPQNIRNQILRLTEERGPDKTICPSEAAKACSPKNWRALMGEVRKAAEALEEQGLISIEQGGEKVSPDEVEGPIRLRRMRKRKRKGG